MTRSRNSRRGTRASRREGMSGSLAHIALLDDRQAADATRRAMSRRMDDVSDLAEEAQLDAILDYLDEDDDYEQPVKAARDERIRDKYGV